jgi:hypothetical protein
MTIPPEDDDLPYATLNPDYDVLAEHHRRSGLQHTLIAITRFPYLIKRQGGNIRGAYNRRQHKRWLRRGLSGARDLYFFGSHINTPTACWEDVDLSFDSEQGHAHFIFMVSSLRDVEEHGRFMWEQGELPSQNSGAKLIPEAFLTEENIQAACENWYKDTVRWWRGHFSHKEGLPRFHFDFTFTDEDDEMPHYLTSAVDMDRFTGEDHESDS